jgi:ferric-dicitrate binding protein FerR (iron transport regulator)
MKPVAQMVVVLAASGLLAIGGPAAAQSLPRGCSAPPTVATQTITCAGGVTVIAEDGAQFTLLDRDRNGEVDSVDLRSKALLLEVPKQRTGRRFEVVTPQAIAAVRGTKWAVDTQATTTSVFVVNGQVGVQRRAGRGRVVLGPGEGVDVENGAGPLTVKRWPRPRVDALMYRLGQ